MSKYRFSIIVPHYDGAISDEVFMEGMNSLAESTFKDFEVLIYHDGPTSRPLPDVSKLGFDYKISETNKRYNDWGHSLRDIGIREAQGEYIVHFNPDNILYPEALRSVDQSIHTWKWFLKEHKDSPRVREMKKTCAEVIISPIIMEGCLRVPHGSMWRTNDSRHRMILSGYPPLKYNVDCMQLVASKNVWQKIGGWSDKSEDSDGELIEKIITNFGFSFCPDIIGVHR